MPTCVVKHCRNSDRRKATGVTFHRFPITMKEAWCSALGIGADVDISHTSVVCSAHFEKEDFFNSGARKLLKPGTVPTINIKQISSSTSSINDDIVPSCSAKDTSIYASPERIRSKIRNSRTSPKRRQMIISPTESSSSSLPSSTELRRRIITIKRFHNYSHSPTRQIRKVYMDKQNMAFSRKRYKNIQDINRKLKVTSLRIVIRKLKAKNLISENAEIELQKSVSGIPSVLLKRLLINSRFNQINKTVYPAELRNFAMTLQFYSQRAYEYVRKTFNHALPHQSTVRKWYSNMNCDPGFSLPAFQVLKRKVEEEREQNNEVFCSLMLDEMAIEKGIELDGTSIRGYVDIGVEFADDERELATEALVVMVVAVNGEWKIPIAYFLIAKLNGEERSGIIKESLIRLFDTGIKIISLTCGGGPQVINKQMMNCLGCNVTDVSSLKTWFAHPIDKTKIYVIFDICHMIKQMRNNWACLGQMKDPDNHVVNVNYINELYKVQENERFYFGNKLKRVHNIEWRKHVMKVKLAAQPLSSSIADALEFLETDMKIDQFQGASATIQFIRIISRLSDSLNSRNSFGTNYNENVWRPFLLNALDYLQHCKLLNNTPMHKSVFKTPFIGFITSTVSFIRIFDDYVKSNQLKYILSYEFSQDHLELFFCRVRCHNESNNNPPTSLQFIRTYKRLLLQHDMTGNYL